MARRWDTDERRHGVASASGRLHALSELAELARSENWVAEDPEMHLLPGLRDRVAISGLSLDEAGVDGDGTLRVRLSSAGRLSRREIRQPVWSILGGAVELTTHVHETSVDGSVIFDVVTGTTPGGQFATHGHTLRIEVAQPG
jgi:hypothetical protein